MALASLWSGSYPMPSASEMARDINKTYDFVVTMLDKGPIPHPGFRVNTAADTYRWLNEVAGTGVLERLGSWSLEGWKFWWNERAFYSLLMGGVDTPFAYRLFDTGRGRKPWPGAREAIEKSNREVKAMAAKWKKEQQTKVA